MSSILVVGTVALDSVKTPFGDHQAILGGSAVYFSVSARYFSPVRLVAVVGKDFPQAHVDFLKKRGVDTAGLMTTSGKTFRWEGEYTGDMNSAKTLATHLNVLAEFNPDIPEEYKKTPYLFLANIDPEIQERVLQQIPRPRLVAADTMNFWITSKRQQLLKLLKKIDLLFLNDGEAKLLSGESNILKAAQHVIRMGPKQVIVKKGEHGALLFHDKTFFCTSAFLLETVVDPTGAGDTFAGGVMGYISRSGKLNQSVFRKAIVHGSVMASFTVEGFSLNGLTKATKRAINARVQEFEKRHYF